jgi:hypothetical protein
MVAGEIESSPLPDRVVGTPAAPAVWAIEFATGIAPDKIAAPLALISQRLV